MPSVSFDELAAAVWAAGVLAACSGFAYMLIRGKLPAKAMATIKRYGILAVLVLIVAMVAWPVVVLLVLWKRRLQGSRT